MNYRFALPALFLLISISPSLEAKLSNTTTQMTVESGFSPDGSAEKLILSAIQRAQTSIRVAAYSFTSPTVVDALLKAKKRGVDIAVIVDYRQNTKMDTKGRGKAALNLLANAKIPVKMLDTKNTQHSKYIILDGLHVQTGSYNYSAAAARYNNENVVLIKNNRTLANQYMANWKSLYAAGTAYKSSY